jgi:hypothetical protein
VEGGRGLTATILASQSPVVCNYNPDACISSKATACLVLIGSDAVTHPKQLAASETCPTVSEPINFASLRFHMRVSFAFLRTRLQRALSEQEQQLGEAELSLRESLSALKVGSMGPTVPVSLFIFCVFPAPS